MKTQKDVTSEECVNIIRSVVGKDVSEEKIRYFLHGADGNIEIALNHILNELEKEKEDEHSPTLPPVEKVLHELAEEVKCPLCLSYFNNPVHLGCYHTFCSSCLEGLITSANTIKCPLCRTNFALTEKGVRGLPVSHYIANIVEKLKMSQSAKLCGECHSSISSVHCKQCKVFLCDMCNDRIHSLQVLKDHDRVLYEDYFENSRGSPLNMFKYTDIMKEFDCVIQFNVKKDVCLSLFYDWIRQLWFAPSDLERNLEIQEFKAVWMPYWLFEVDAFSKVVEKNSQEIQTGVSVKYTRFKDIMVCASGSRDATVLQHLEPWKTEQIQPFTLQHTEGVEVRPFSLKSEKAWATRGKEKIEEMNRQAYKKQMSNRFAAELSTFHVNIDTTYSGKKARRVFVPIYVATYEYHGKVYRFLINGSTAKYYGSRPYSVTKLASLGFGGLGAAVGLLRMNN